MRNLITVNGRTMIWEDFIRILDHYRDSNVILRSGTQNATRYCYMIHVLQVLAEDYHEGSDYIPDNEQDFITQMHLRMPAERTLPGALEELFNQMQANMNIDLSEILDAGVKKSQETQRRMQEAVEKEDRRIALIQSLQFTDEDVSKKVSYLLSLQSAKNSKADYHVSKKEILATSLWCEILILGLSSEFITYNIMRRAVENDFISARHITALLNDKYQIKNDYEWFSEAYMGCDLDEFTEIKVNDFLELC